MFDHMNNASFQRVLNRLSESNAARLSLATRRHHGQALNRYRVVRHARSAVDAAARPLAAALFRTVADFRRQVDETRGESVNIARTPLFVTRHDRDVRLVHRTFRVDLVITLQNAHLKLQKTGYTRFSGFSTTKAAMAFRRAIVTAALRIYNRRPVTAAW